jgi:hypothetical protein
MTGPESTKCNKVELKALEPGQVYLVLENEFSNKDSMGIRYFFRTVRELDGMGLAFLREAPEVIKQRFKISASKYDLFWIYGQETNIGKNLIKCSDLEHVVGQIGMFAQKHKKKGVVYTDALNYLIQQNGNEKVITYLKSKIYDIAKTVGTPMILSVRPDALDAKELANLEVYLTKL